MKKQNHNHRGVDLSKATAAAAEGKPNEAPTGDNTSADAANTDGNAGDAEGKPNEAPTGEGTGTEVAEVAKDPFADLPTVKLHEAEVLDLSGVETSNPRKYAKVQETASAEHMPVQKGWKHERAMFVPGTARKELKPGSVHGDVQAIVNAAGRAGISAVDLATQLRIKQVGNKRSHYCDKLPPVGWAEGWINSAVTRNIIGVSATKRAPALRPEEAAATDAKGDGKAEDRKAA